MADFCKQCSEEIFGEDFCELISLVSLAQTREGLYALALCEGCGHIQVDHEGACVTKDCLKEHGKTYRTYDKPLPDNMELISVEEFMDNYIYEQSKFSGMDGGWVKDGLLSSDKAWDTGKFNSTHIAITKRDDR